MTSPAARHPDKRGNQRAMHSTAGRSVEQFVRTNEGATAELNLKEFGCSCIANVDGVRGAAPVYMDEMI